MSIQPGTQAENSDLPVVQLIVSVVWPSFIVACIATIVFFILFDPSDLALIAGIPELPRLGGYTLGFFGFWLLSALSSGLTCYFRRPCRPYKPADQED